MTENDVLVTLPPGFVAIKFPGYFWNLRTKQLYSIKSGLLKPIRGIPQSTVNYLISAKPQFFNRVTGYPMYCVSVNGCKRYIFKHYLESLCPVEYEIPVV